MPGVDDTEPSPGELLLDALLRLLDHYDVAPAVFAELLRHQIDHAESPSTCLRRDGPDMYVFDSRLVLFVIILSFLCRCFCVR